MSNRDPRIDAYISKSAGFAKPILNHLRELVHKACPGVEENIKWSRPFFDYKGSVLCMIAAFKEHCTFRFWKAALLKEVNLDRITSLKDLPSDKIMIDHIKEAARLNEEDIKLAPRKKPAAQKPLKTPKELEDALKKNKKARAFFDEFSPSHKKEYIEWITEAKTEATREKRLETAIAWIAEGKPRHWKYIKK